jgi:uroporphyrinogen decarboxylase
MTSLERMQKVFKGIMPDRSPFVPSIYEHGARVINETPSRASLDAELMAKAAIESYKLYNHDLVTVGIDIYNIEAEAFGCPVQRFDTDAIPAIKGHPLAMSDLNEIRDLRIPEEGPDNRLGLITNASQKTFNEIGDRVMVYACMGGPFSQAVELRSFEQLLVDITENPETAHSLLEKTTELSVRHALNLSENFVGINLYESWATLPLISPEIFRDFVVPYEKKIISAVKSHFDTPPPTVIMGGDTSMLIDFFIETDTALVVADYMTDFDFIQKKLREAQSKIVIRGCLDPKQIERGDWDNLQPAIFKLAQKSKDMANFVWGCGCVPLDTPQEYLLRFKQMCLEASAQMRGDILQ